MSSKDAAYTQRLLAKVMALAESERSRTFVIPNNDSDLRPLWGKLVTKVGSGPFTKIAIGDPPHPSEGWYAGTTKNGERCLNNAVADGLCKMHWRMSARGRREK